MKKVIISFANGEKRAWRIQATAAEILKAWTPGKVFRFAGVPSPITNVYIKEL